MNIKNTNELCLSYRIRINFKLTVNNQKTLYTSNHEKLQLYLK